MNKDILNNTIHNGTLKDAPASTDFTTEEVNDCMDILLRVGGVSHVPDECIEQMRSVLLACAQDNPA